MGDIRYINPNYIVPHYSTKLWRSYFHYVQRYYSETIFDKIIEEMHVPKSYLLQDGNWVSNDFSIEFMRRLKDLTGDNAIARNVGRFNLEPENINPFEFALLKATPPFVFFRILPFEFRKMNNYTALELLKKGGGSYVYRLKPLQENANLHDEAVCGGFMGSFDAISGIYNLKNLKASHSSCVHKGDNQCIFEVSYDIKSYWLRAVMKLSGIGASVLGLMLLAWKTNLYSSHAPILYQVSFVGFILMTFVSLITLAKTRAIIKHHVIHEEQSRHKNHELAISKAQLDRRYQESKMQRDLALKLVQAGDQRRVIEFCIDALSDKFNYPKSFIMLLNADQDHLNTVVTRGLGDYTDQVSNLSLIYPDPRNISLIFTKILEEGKSRLVTDIPAFVEKLAEPNQNLVKRLDVNSLIVVPIQSESAKYGLVVVGSGGNEKKLEDDDRYLIENITRMLSLYFQSARQFEKERSLRILFEKFVPSLVMDSFRDVDVDHPSAHLPRMRKIISIFLDLRGFTKISENKDPGKVVEMLNIYFEFVSNHLEKYSGVVDNLIGDGICGFFVDDGELEETVNNAFMACVEIIAGVDEVQKAFAERGFEFGGIGIGLHAGEAILGTIGSSKKLNFTAVGDVVNTASRLQELTKAYCKPHFPERANLVVSEILLDRLTMPFESHPLEAVELRGRRQPVQCHRINEDNAKAILNLGKKKAAA